MGGDKVLVSDTFVIFVILASAKSNQDQNHTHIRITHPWQNAIVNLIISPLQIGCLEFLKLDGSGSQFTLEELM